MAWTTKRQPFGPNKAPLLAGTSITDGTSVPVAVNPATGAILTQGGTASGLVTGSYDYIAYTATSSTVDTYVYKSGGAAGSTVATVTITYTDTSKTQVSTIART